MKMIVMFVITIFIFLLIFQTLYTGYFFKRAENLTEQIYVGEKMLGDSKNPEFKLFVAGDSVGAGVGASAFNTSVAGRVAEFYARYHHVKSVNNSENGSKMESLADKTVPPEKQNLTLL